MSIEQSYEQEHIKAIINRLRRIDQVYDTASKDIAKRIAAYKLKYPGTWQGGSFFKYNKGLEKQVNNVLYSLRNGVYENIRNGSASAWDMANAKNDMLVRSYIDKINVPSEIMTTMSQLNINALNTFLDRIDNGFTTSQRVWKCSSIAKKNIELYLSSGIATGKPAAAITRDIRESLKEPNRLFRRVRNKDGKLVMSQAAKRFHPGRGVYRSSYKNALRLAGNEINVAYRTSDMQRRAQLPFVVGVEVHLSNAHPEIDICDEMKGRYPKSFIWLPGS